MKNNKIYLVSANDYNYDQYDSFVIIASSKEEAIKIAMEEPNFDLLVKVKEVGTALDTEEIGILLGSYNRG